MRRIPSVAVLVLYLAIAGVASSLAEIEPAGKLDQRTFDVTLVGPDGKEEPDTLIFADGSFDSVGCREYGFGRTPYEATSSEEGTIRWAGTITNETIAGSMEWIKKGQDALVYGFRGARIAPPPSVVTDP